MHFAPCKKRRACQILHFSGGQQPYTQPWHGATTTKAAQLLGRDFLYLLQNSLWISVSNVPISLFAAPEQSQVGAA